MQFFYLLAKDYPSAISGTIDATARPGFLHPGQSLRIRVVPNIAYVSGASLVHQVSGCLIALSFLRRGSRLGLSARLQMHASSISF